MESAPGNRPLLKRIIPFLSVASVSLVVLALVSLSVFHPIKGIRHFFGSDVSGTASSIFSNLYPASERFRDELEQLRISGRLKPDDEQLVQRSIAAASNSLHMPPAILWCLLFQESRLNHLEGIDEAKGATGIGQFSTFSFFEVNNQLDRFGKDNLVMFTDLLGRDVRPIEPRKTDLFSPSSYYSIPTGVVASAAYLNNRFLQLERILNKQNVPFTKDILWLHAAIAYNKGTRSVLSMWSQSRKRFGQRMFERLVLESETLFARTEDIAFLTLAMRQIWPPSQALQYARELKTHMSSMRECTLDSTIHHTLNQSKEVQ